MNSEIKSIYPRILVISLGRINLSDTYNNGLFLRNLFGFDFPRENLAQIYSSGDNRDQGFFSRYYCLTQNDRFLGSIFYRIKAKKVTDLESISNIVNSKNQSSNKLLTSLKRKITSLIVDTGLYELFFRPKLSAKMLAWVDEFNPDIILAQGYNLTFTWLPLMLKRATGKPLAVLTTDDWPKYLYAGTLGESSIFKFLVRPIVKKAAADFFKFSDVHFAFGHPMATEYSNRYKKQFSVLNHSDNPDRFNTNSLHKFNYGTGIKSIVVTGNLNKFRWPLLIDANEACKKLNLLGYNIKIFVLLSTIDPEGLESLKNLEHVEIKSDPGNDNLPAYLKGADILLLAEGFDEKFVSAIELSISSKAHLFMFSKRPIIVYAAEKTGVAQYAITHKWAEVIKDRSPDQLAASIKNLLDGESASEITKKATEVALKHHTHASNQSIFLEALSKFLLERSPLA